MNSDTQSRAPIGPRLIVIVTLLLGMTIAGIWSGEDRGELFVTSEIAIARSNQTRDTDPRIDPAEINLLVQGNNAFAFELYLRIRDEEGNLLFSPYSLSQVLAMTAVGARGDTQQQMSATLHFDADDEQAHATFNALDLSLISGDESEDGFRFENVNGLWGQQGSEYEASFLGTLGSHYGAAMRLLDFDQSPDSARLAINRWASEKTQGRIEELIPQGGLGSDTRLVLTNAVYFRALWQYPFDRRATSTGEFKLRSGKSISVDMMRQRGTFLYMSDRDFAALELPYADSDMAMTIILPDKGDFDAVESQLSAEFVADVVEQLHSGRAEVELPRFEFAAEFELSDDLRRLGMVDAFSNSADFSGMSTDGKLRLDTVHHKAFISVDEESTEAAAASSAGVVLTSLPARFVADRPFLFLIRDRSTGAVLFIGRVDDPSSR